MGLKRVICAVVLTLCAARAAVFAQDRVKNTVSVGSRIPFENVCGEIAYERLLVEKIALLASLNLAIIQKTEAADANGMPRVSIGREYGALMVMRLYPISCPIGRLFIDLGGGYTLLLLVTGTSKDEDYGLSHLVKARLALGWRFELSFLSVEISAGMHNLFGDMDIPDGYPSGSIGAVEPQFTARIGASF